MPSNTTAMDWAIIVDNVEALKLMKEKIRSDSDSGRPNVQTIKPIRTQLSYAAQFQSVRCLKYLVAINNDELSHLDPRGFSSLYYAIRPNVFDRILRYQQKTDDPITGQSTDESVNQQDVAPFLVRQIEIIDILITSGCTQTMHRQGLFNALHIASAVGEHEILRHLLQTPSFEAEINQISAFGWTPLKEAIIRGRPAAVDLLLEHNADQYALWPAKRCHALHICCLYQGSQSVEIAKRLLKDNSSALRHKNHRNSTPLHEASQYGHSKLIELFITAGARLLDIDLDRLTPLGLAVRYRFVLAVALLSRKHKEQKLPFQASSGLWRNPNPFLVPLAIVPPRGRYVSALQYLLAPGVHSPSDEIVHDLVLFQRGLIHIGTYDAPFSASSVQILEILVKNYEHHTRFGVNLCLSLNHAIYRYDSGLHWAIRMANVDAVHCILSQQSGFFKPAWRELIELAYSQRSLGREHVGSEAARKEIISMLREQQFSSHKTLSDRRTRTGQNSSLLLTRFWRTYYSIYGHLEQRQYDRANEWLMEARPTVEPRFLEFRQWYYPRFSLYYVLFGTLWLILIPTLSCYAVVARDPSAHISAANIAYSVTVVVLVS